MIEKLKSIAFIGATAERMFKQATEMNVKAKMEIFNSLEDAFNNSLAIGNGGAILLSPACASFGLFKNYKHRGEVFNQLIENF